MNGYVEHMVKGQDAPYWKILKALNILAIAISIFMTGRFRFSFIFTAIFCLLYYFLRLNSSVEYEYLYIEGSFSVDKILNKTKRKPVVETGKDALILIADEDSDYAKAELSNNCEKIDCSGKRRGEKRYAYIYRDGSKKKCVYIDIDKKLYDEMRHFTPSKMRIDKVLS